MSMKGVENFWTGDPCRVELACTVLANGARDDDFLSALVTKQVAALNDFHKRMIKVFVPNVHEWPWFVMSDLEEVAMVPELW